MSRRNPGGAALVLVGGLVAGTLAACGGAPGGSATVVSALWYGKQSDGSLASGITLVDIVTDRRADSVDFSVDLEGLKSAGTGDVWNAAAWSAATTGALTWGVDPRGLDVDFKVSESIDGPSAGGLMTTGVMADLQTAQIQSDVTMTGTILPNGAIGRVGGIPEKLRAAKDAGFTRVLIPMGQRKSYDPRTSTQMDVIEQGAELGIEVAEISSVTEAYQNIVGELPERPTGSPSPLDAELVNLLNIETKAALARLSRPTTLIAMPPKGTLSKEHDRIVAGVAATKARVPEMLKGGKDVAAFSRATLTERELSAWNAQVAAVAAAESEPVTTRKDLLNRAEAVSRQSREAVAGSASATVTYLEQLVALPDALAWGVDAAAGASADAATLADSAKVLDGSALGRIAADLAIAQYEVETYLPVAVSAIEVVGKETLTDRQGVLGLLDSYADFLAQASEANLNYFHTSDSTGPAASVFFEEDLAEQLEDLWQQQPATGESDQAAVMMKLSVAISSFTTTTGLVAAKGILSAVSPGDGMLSRIRIQNQEAFATQIKIADELNIRQGELLAGLALDSSYFRWSAEWGLALATSAPESRASDDLLREGLTYQWFATVQAKLLATAHNSQ